MALSTAKVDSESGVCMRRSQRKLHSYIWLVLPVGLLLIVFMSVVDRQQVTIDQAVDIQGGVLP
jgi:hypothetical protein